MQSLPIPPAVSGGTYIPPDKTFEILTAEPLVKFLTRAVQPPSSVYITNRDALQVSAASSQAGESLTVNWRVLGADGKIVFSQFVMQVTSDRAINVHKENLPEGFLLSLSLKAAAATTRGQTFARAFLTTSGLGAGQPAAMLMSDYVTTAMAPGFPNGRTLTPGEGPGWTRVVSVAGPAASVDWFTLLPANAKWKLIMFSATLTTDATAGARYAQFVATDLRIGALTAGQGPSSAIDYVCLPGGTHYVAVTGQVLPNNTHVVDLPLPPDYFMISSGIASLTSFVGVADQWSSINLHVEELLDNV